MPDALALEPRKPPTLAPRFRLSPSRLLAEKTEWSARHVERQRHRWVIVVEIGKRMLEVLLANVADRVTAYKVTKSVSTTKGVTAAPPTRSCYWRGGCPSCAQKRGAGPRGAGVKPWLCLSRAWSRRRDGARAAPAGARDDSCAKRACKGLPQRLTARSLSPP